MQHYRLLRNNRESGPYSREDLIVLGLKAYDLIWVEGKSSAWKYPSEVESLKSFSPPATEDLYVIFHTPKLAQQSAVNSVSTKSGNTTTLSDKGSRRYVSVILPATKEQKAVSSTSTTIQPQNLPTVNSTWTEQTEDTFPGDSKIAVTNIITYKSKNRYLIAISFLVLLATGIYFGTSNKNNSADQQNSVEPVATGSLVSLTSPVTEQIENLNDRIEIPVLKPNKSLEFAAAKRNIQLNIPEYNVGFFGGISGLQITVRNTGKFKLNNVVIAVDFLNKNKNINHTENVAIPFLEPGKDVTIPVYDSSDGIAIQTRIIGVNDLSAQ